MVDITELVLGALPIPVILGFMYWGLRLQSSLSNAERIRLKWKDLSVTRKLLGVSLSGYFAVVVYLDVAAILNLTRILTLPFSGIGSLVLIWVLTVGFVGLAYLQSVTHPRKVDYVAR